MSEEDFKERRNSSLEHLLVEFGKLHEIAKSTKETVDGLSTKVGIQNGRVGKLERWQSFLYGISAVLTLLVIPLAIHYLPNLLRLVAK